MGVDPAFFDFGPCRLYSLQLFGVFWFVVLGQLNYGAISTEGRPGVSSIRNNYPIAHDHDNIGGAAYRIRHFAIRKGLHSILYRNLAQLLLALLGVHQLVQLHEDGDQGFVVVACLVELVFLHHDSEVVGAELCNFATPVAVEHSEQEYLLVQAIVQYGVLHVLAPA